MTTSTTRWSSANGTPDPVARPGDPFATIPGAYDDELWPADLVMDTTRVDETGSSVVTRAATVADLVDADDDEDEGI